MNSKACTLCKETKKLISFSKHTTSKDGRQTRCKTCQANIAKRRRAIAPRNSDKYRLRKTLVDYIAEDSELFLRTL